MKPAFKRPRCSTMCAHCNTTSTGGVLETELLAQPVCPSRLDNHPRAVTARCLISPPPLGDWAELLQLQSAKRIGNPPIDVRSNQPSVPHLLHPKYSARYCNLHRCHPQPPKHLGSFR
ncbi:hypothetical protein PGTUg99_020195 [Puccinia graminis f. sp. tritici]|uniref:Uncharacterized protein n=1 Tax=Puccinia graminis f. sp. tritici TaxID=56615 RepID=A0A5B0SBN1_PUCGR|nr:hypothetical protein PGTUg99_020195 [Puccinia graminis f. sp. tritici]